MEVYSWENHLYMGHMFHGYFKKPEGEWLEINDNICGIPQDPQASTSVKFQLRTAAHLDFLGSQWAGRPGVRSFGHGHSAFLITFRRYDIH